LNARPLPRPSLLELPSPVLLMARDYAGSSPAMLWGMALGSRVRVRIDSVMTQCVMRHAL